jgi:hypothetical protein
MVYLFFSPFLLWLLVFFGGENLRGASEREKMLYIDASGGQKEKQEMHAQQLRWFKVVIKGFDSLCVLVGCKTRFFWSNDAAEPAEEIVFMLQKERIWWRRKFSPVPNRKLKSCLEKSKSVIHNFLLASIGLSFHISHK